MSSNIVSIQPCTHASGCLNMNEMTKSPITNNIKVSYNRSQNVPPRCYQSVRPPPPHTSVPIINSNGYIKNCNKTLIGLNGFRKPASINIDTIRTKNELEYMKYFHGKKSPEKGGKRIDVRATVLDTPAHDQDCNSNEIVENLEETHLPYVNPYYNRPGFFYKQRGFTSRCDRTSKNKKRTAFIPEEYYSHIDILMDKFLSRSSYINSQCLPLNLKADQVWDSLNSQIWKAFIAHQQSNQTYKNKIMLWRYLYTFIRKFFPRYGLFLVGSTMSGFGLSTSDVDMCMQVRTTSVDQRIEAPNYLDQIYNALKSCEFIDRIEFIWAKVPILKFHDSARDIEVDLNCNNAVGIRNTHLMHCYAHMDWRVRPLVLIIKLWAKENNINDAKNMTISSYSIVLMVIHYLQCGVTPPVIPCLHGLYPEKFQPNSDIHTIDMQEYLHPFHSDNNQTLGELLVGFLQYYSFFDYSIYAISVRLGARIPIDECRMARTLKNEPHQWKYLCIEEPFDLTNTARSVYDPEVFQHIKSVFVYSYKQLESTYDLKSILKLNDMKL